MSVLQLLLVVSVSAILVHSDVIRFDNHRVYSISITNNEQLNILRDIEATLNSYVFLQAPVAVNSSINVVVQPNKQRNFDRLCNTLGLQPTLQNANLQKLIDNERPNRHKRANFGWEDYYTLDEIYAWVNEIAEQYSDVVTVETLGQSYEGRDLKVIKVSYKEGNPGIFMDANIHAREWITSATVTWILNQLLTSDNPEVRNLAENYDWYIVPVLNPDGFDYTHTTDRLWRKTRKPYNVLCVGADPNRNFAHQWGNGGTSNNPCSDLYAGPEAESEQEVKIVSDYIKSIASNLGLYLTIHSYGQYLLFPYGYNNAPRAPNYNDLMQIGTRAAVDMYKVHQKPYRVGTTGDVLYVAAGISVDWAYGVANIPLSYTFELRDQTEFGFILPADQIIPNAEEVLAAFIGMVDEASVLGYF